MSTSTQHELVEAYTDIPYAVLEDLESSIRQDLFKEFAQIKKYYREYEAGIDFTTEGHHNEYTPSMIKYKKSRSLIDKEARFMFSKTPSIEILAEGDESTQTLYTNLVEKVLKDNHWKEKLVKASKDCFIGKRVACILNFNNRVDVSFLPSLEFYYETDENMQLSKIIGFFTTLESSSAATRRVMKKEYYMDKGYCHVTEQVFNGSGKKIQDNLIDVRTNFTYIPACIIINDGLTGDIKGVSEIELLSEYEQGYSRLANADIDAERKSMNCTKYVIDGSYESTQNLSNAAGAFWDIQSNQTGAEQKTATIGMLEPSMSYSSSLKTTLDRLENSMHEQLDVPNLSSEKLQGMITSGKTLEALYWSLMVRCDEKFLTWFPAIEFIVRAIIEGVSLYPDSNPLKDKITMKDFKVAVSNNYPIPKDEEAQKTSDIIEVNANSMSRKAYLKKWRKLTDKEADLELEQILREKQMFEEAYISNMS